jgi:ubiquinone/menaquinone biosynthesis C-methylase UbiE
MNYFDLKRRVPEGSAIEPKTLAWYYAFLDRVPVVHHTHARVVAGALALGVTRGCGLDVGTGPGPIAVEIARQRPGLTMVGLDLAAHMLEEASRQAARAALDSRGAWSQADGHCLPFADGSFDLVVSSLALHHWDDPLRVLNEIARVLRRPDTARGEPGGRYYIGDVCREVNLLQRLFAYSSIPVVSLPFGSYRRYGGYYESVRAGYTVDEAEELLKRSDLPDGEVGLISTWFIPILTISSRKTG